MTWISKTLFNLLMWIAPREAQLHIAYAMHKKVEDVIHARDLYPDFRVDFEEQSFIGRKIH